MPMLWRLDAQHSNGDGALTMFRPALRETQLMSDQLKSAGWLVDHERIDVGPLPEWQTDLLCLRVWPVSPLATLIFWAQQSRLLPSDHAFPINPETTFSLVEP